MSDEEKIESKFICVWLDNQLMKTEDYVDTQDQLETLVKIFRTFRNSDQCVDFITDITEEKIFFITTNILGKFLVPLIHSYEQIDSIYLFYSTKSTDNELIWTKDYKKIKEIFHDIKLIPNRFLKDTTEKQKNDPIAISFVSSVDINSNDLNRQDPTFMYFQLIKEILLNDHSSESYEETKNEMISFCRQIYVDDPNAIVILDEFEQSFIPELSIYWYTRECFLYKLLNKALWTPQPDVLYKLRYFIRHLYYQILSEAQTQRQQLSSMIVYRGQTMSADQINKLKQNVGGFLSFNNFLSTSLEKDVARNFLIGSEEIGVLFEMQIDPTIEKFPMVNIELISYLKKEDCEQELLFAIGSVFRIIQIQQQENNLYRVQLKLSEDVDQQLAEYTKRTREKTRTSHSFLSLLRLMNELSQYSSVDQFAEILREDVALGANPSTLAAVHHMLGSIYHARGQSKKALDYYQKSHAIYLDFLPADHPTLTPTYNNMACVYLSQSNYNKAFEFQKLALNCESNSKHPNPSSLILYTNNLGRIHRCQEKYNEALEYYKSALELQKQFLGENDPSLAETYNMISSICYKINDYEQGTLYSEQAAALEKTTCQSNPTASADRAIRVGTACHSQGQYQEALVHFNRALEIQQQFFLPNNPSLATTYDHIARAYYKLEKFEEALPYYKKALEVEQNSLSADHPSIATSYFNISKAYVSLSRWLEASEYGLKAIEQLRKSLRTDVNTLASYTQHVGHIYDQEKQYEHALVYYEDALELYRTHLCDDYLSLLSIYQRTGKVYYKLQRYDQALVLYQNVLNIELKILPDNAGPLANAYSDISSAYLGLKQFDEASVAAEQALYQALKTLPYNHPDVVQYRANSDYIRQKQKS